MLPVLTELRHALDMQSALESLVEEGNYCKVGSYIWLVYDLQFLIFFFLVHHCNLIAHLLLSFG
jgi:hypothetical protein